MHLEFPAALDALNMTACHFRLLEVRAVQVVLTGYYSLEAVSVLCPHIMSASFKDFQSYISHMSVIHQSYVSNISVISVIINRQQSMTKRKSMCIGINAQHLYIYIGTNAQNLKKFAAAACIVKGHQHV